MFVCRKIVYHLLYLKKKKEIRKNKRQFFAADQFRTRYVSEIEGAANEICARSIKKGNERSKRTGSR